MNTEQNLTHNIHAINPNMEKLKQAFPHCFDKNGDFDFAKFREELEGSGMNIAKEGYALNWLGKSYARVLASDAATTLLREDEAHNAKPENANSENLLIKGDNLEVLKHLSNAYYEKVKMIYIDPPYNTGSDGFVYNDDRKFTAKQLQELAGVSEDEAKRILEFTQSNSNSHSAWLTFMYPRLYIAKQLLKGDGVIFVSIDDNEVAQLRLLMDEVFGEENFISEIIWERAYAPVNLVKHFSTSHDHILVYAKNINFAVNNGLTRNEEVNNRYQNPDNDPRGVWSSSDISVGPAILENIYPITAPSGRVIEPPTGRSWSLSANAFAERLRDNRIWFGSDGNGVPRIKRFLSELKKDGITPMTIWKYTEVGHSQEASQSLKKLFEGKMLFDYPKSVNLIKRILQLYSDKDCLILDFFAGSGTTAHSVMQLNAEDGGNRKFILVQLPELIDPKKSKTAYDFVEKELGVTPPTIFEITKERIIRAAKQINAELDSKIEKLKNEPDTEENKAEIAKNLTLKTQNSFKIFETTPIWEDYDFQATQLANAPQLFDDNQLTEEDIKALFTTWKTSDGIVLTEPVQTVDLAGYTAYYTKQKLYLMHKDFGTETLKALLEKIDADAYFNPTAIIAFGYYFESKALREIAENIKTYNNKKNIDIDFITRY
ncbi:site-specific DNA-methyltransferase [Bergeyella porcorum]|uniref:site-specific DNA-methyltransferase n=1 Tax=Bergeyella porcorum TaxID=1735111 RepID=UPI0035F0F3AF